MSEVAFGNNLTNGDINSNTVTTLKRMLAK